MANVGELLNATIFGGSGAARDLNDKIMNWGDIRNYLEAGVLETRQNLERSLSGQGDYLAKALGQTPELYMNQYEPMRQLMTRNANRQLAARGLSGSGQAVSSLNDLNSQFNNQVFNQALQRINSNNALFMNAANQNTGALSNASNTLANLYSNMGNLRYNTSVGKSAQNVWGGF